MAMACVINDYQPLNNLYVAIGSELPNNQYSTFERVRDVIIVLGGGISLDGVLTENSMKRAKKGLELYLDELAPRLLMSGKCPPNRKGKQVPNMEWIKSVLRSYTEAREMKEYAQQLLPTLRDEDVFLEEFSTNTYENALYCKKYFLEPLKWHDVVVVTSDYHVERASRIFNEVLGEDYLVEFISHE